MMCCADLLKRAFALVLVATLITACGGGGGGEAATTPVVVPGTPTLNSLPTIAPGMKSNELQIYVDAGPAGTDYNVNRLYTDVTVCFPGKSSPGSPTQCQTIDHVLVDTGSTGLRLLSSVMAPALNLNRQMATGELPLLNCAQFVDDTSAWGPVVTADVVLGGKTAAGMPIQVIGDPVFNSLTAASPSPCSGAPMTTAKELGANGILGVGLLKEDCGLRCINLVNNRSYYTCTDAGCTAPVGEKASLDQQVQNPVTRFATDNNGVLISLPFVTPTDSARLDGTLTFGIGTQSLASVTVLATNSSGRITTLLAAPNQPSNFSNSFIDSGSNGLFFDSIDSTMTKCGPGGEGFYCPASPATLSATLVGANGATRTVSFSVDKATDLFAGGVNHVLPTLAGDSGGTADIFGHPPVFTFDWGLPFFYGRPVFFGIEGQASTLGTGPFYAF